MSGGGKVQIIERNIGKGTEARVTGQRLWTRPLPSLLPLEVPRGNVDGLGSENKFGRAPNLDQVDTDIWDFAATQQIFVAPTAARAHSILSDSGNDVGPAGTGARTIRIYGLTSWDADEVSEDLTMNGLGGVLTVNAYVIIYRAEILTWGSAGPNVGTVAITAAVDATRTATILPGEGQTQMAIYGVPSTKIAYMTGYYAGLNRSTGSTSNVDISLLVNDRPDAELTGFKVKHTLPLRADGVSYFPHPFNPYRRFPGPAIIKIQGIGSANSNDVSAGFDLYLEDN